MDGACTGCLAWVLSSCLRVHQCWGHLLMFTFRSMEMGAQRAQAAYWKLLVNDSVTCVHAKSLQSCPTLCNPMDWSPPVSSAYSEIYKNQKLRVLIRGDTLKSIEFPREIELEGHEKYEIWIEKHLGVFFEITLILMHCIEVQRESIDIPYFSVTRGLCSRYKTTNSETGLTIHHCD